MTPFLPYASIHFHMTCSPFSSLLLHSNPRTCIVGLPASCTDSRGASKPSFVLKNVRKDQGPHLGLLGKLSLFCFLLFSSWSSYSISSLAQSGKRTLCLSQCLPF